MTVTAERARRTIENTPVIAVGQHEDKPSRPRPTVPAVLYRVDEAAEALRLSRSSIYELIRSGRLRTVKHGSRRLVPVEALDEFVEALVQGVS